MGKGRSARRGQKGGKGGEDSAGPLRTIKKAPLIKAEPVRVKSEADGEDSKGKSRGRRGRASKGKSRGDEEAPEADGEDSKGKSRGRRGGRASKGKSRGDEGAPAAREAKGRGKSQDAKGAPRFEKISGTRIVARGDKHVRVVVADGKEYAPNDVRGAQSHLAKLDQTDGGQAAPRNQNAGKGTRGGGRDAGKGIRGGGGGGGGREHVHETVKMVKGRDGKMVQQIVRTITIVKGEGKGQGRQGKGEGKGKKRNNIVPGKTMKKLKKGQGEGKERGPRKRKDREPRERKERTPEEEAAFQEKAQERHQTKVKSEGRELASDDFYTGEVVRGARGYAWVKPTEGSAFPADFEAKMKEMNEEARSKKAEKGKGGTTDDDDVLYLASGDVVEDGLDLKPGLQVQFKIYTDNKGVGGCAISSIEGL